MKPSVNKNTAKFLEGLDSKVEEDVANYYSGKDDLDRLMYIGTSLIMTLPEGAFLNMKLN